VVETRRKQDPHAAHFTQQTENFTQTQTRNMASNIDSNTRTQKDWTKTQGLNTRPNT